MANPLDTDAGSELFESYSAEFRLVEADLAQKLDTIPELSGEPRKAAISQAERALEEAEELVRWPYSVPSLFALHLLTWNPTIARPDATREAKHSYVRPDKSKPAFPRHANHHRQVDPAPSLVARGPLRSLWQP